MYKLIPGILTGMVIMGVFSFMLMPKMMIKTYKSRFDHDLTVEKISAAISEAGWSNKGLRYFDQEIQRSTGIDIGSRVTAIHLCKAEYAQKILAEDDLRFVSAIMPCTISVWEGQDGQTYVSKMNTGLMGKMFGGIIAEIMGGKVAQEEHQMLEPIVDLK